MTALDDANWSPGPKYRELLARANDLLGDERPELNEYSILSLDEMNPSEDNESEVSA